MRVFNRSTVKAFADEHPDARQQLYAWFKEVAAASWLGPDDIKARYASASFMGGNRVVFNILVNIKPIRTSKDHGAALREIERLWGKAKPGTPDGDRFEVLSALVDAYEREHVEIPAPDPIEAIRFRMEQEGLTNKDLLPIFKTRARVSEVMSRRRRLNLPMIRKLHQKLDIPFDCLVQAYKLKRAGSGRSRHR